MLEPYTPPGPPVFATPGRPPPPLPGVIFVIPRKPPLVPDIPFAAPFMASKVNNAPISLPPPNFEAIESTSFNTLVNVLTSIVAPDTTLLIKGRRSCQSLLITLVKFKREATSSPNLEPNCKTVCSFSLRKSLKLPNLPEIWSPIGLSIFTNAFSIIFAPSINGLRLLAIALKPSLNFSQKSLTLPIIPTVFGRYSRIVLVMNLSSLSAADTRLSASVAAPNPLIAPESVLNPLWKMKNIS